MNKSIWTGAYWKAVAERMIRGFAIGCLLIVGGNSVNAFNVDWSDALGFGLGGAVLSLLFSLAGNVATGGGPSLTRTETVAPITDDPAPKRGVIINNGDGTPVA
jgi:hypothetical protein